MAWIPILDGALAQAARVAVRELAASLPSTIELEPGLASGLSGVAIFHAQRARFDDEPHASSTAKDLFARALDELADRSVGAGLFSGLAGVGWSIEHCVAPAIDDEFDPSNVIDEKLVAMIDREEWPGHFDLVSGLAGICVYFLGRLPRAIAARGLECAVRHLETRAYAADRCAWFTPPELLPPWQREASPRGQFDIGMAHGVPGVLATLARIHASGTEVKGLLPLLERATGWLLDKRSRSPGGECFPRWLENGVTPRPGRSAWCYGDPGVAAAIWSVGVATARADLVSFARKIAIQASEMSIADSRVQDASVCHGAFGLAHLFNRFYQASRDPRFRDTAVFWIERGLDMRVAGCPFGGFPKLHDGRVQVFLPSLLEGGAGAGLALLAALSEIEPTWDRILLCDLPVC